MDPGFVKKSQKTNLFSINVGIVIQGSQDISDEHAGVAVIKRVE
jgi:hypothetical protein